MLYIKVSIPIMLFKTFIYSYDKSKKNLFIGQGVKINFHNREVLGFIIHISNKTSYKSQINPILLLNNNSIKISNELIQTINWVANYYICPIGKTLKATIPYQLFSSKILQEKYIKISSKGQLQLENINFVKQKLILKYLSQCNDYVRLSTLKNISSTYHQSCKSLLKKGYVDIDEKKKTYKFIYNTI